MIPRSLSAFGLLVTVGPAISAPASPGNDTNQKLVSSGTIEGMTIPPGTKAAVIADFKNQQVTSPTALAFGSKGEIYIAETHRLRHGVADNREHLYWYLDDIASRTTADRRKMHEKWQNQEASTSLKFLTEKEDLVRVLSDPDAGGVFRKQDVFAGKFNDALVGIAAGVFEYEGTVFLACIPKIYALRDKDGNGEADVRDVIQDGFGIHVSRSGHDMNGFVLGADCRLYGSLGDRGMNFTTKEGRHYEQPAYILPPVAHLTTGPSGLTYHPGCSENVGKDRGSLPAPRRILFALPAGSSGENRRAEGKTPARKSAWPPSSRCAARSHRSSPVSSMRPMTYLLSAVEMRNVIAWLSELKRKPRKKKPGPAPVKVTP